MDIRNSSLFQRHSDHVSEMMQRLSEHQRATGGETSSTSDPFSSLMMRGISQVNENQLDSQAKIESLLSGEDINQAEVFTSIQKADMSFRLLVQIRNKLLQAFEELNAIRV